MNTQSPFKRLLKKIPFKQVVAGGGIFVLLLIGITAFYYITTPANTIIVTTAEFPSGLSTSFTPDHLTDHSVAYLQRMINEAESGEVSDPTFLEGLGPRPAKQTIIPRALSNPPSPFYKIEWRGVSLNFCRKLGMSLKAKGFLELGVVGTPPLDGWRFTAFLKDASNSAPRSAGSAPRNGGSCHDFENCANDLTEQVLQVLDSRRLLNVYIRRKTPESNRGILELYKIIPNSSLQAEDFVAWGNAFFGLDQFDEALQKYQQALEKDPHSCSAQVARGFVYYSRPHGTQLLPDLQRAEQDFRAGLSCEPRNEYTLTSLCHTLLKQWANSKNPEAQKLEEAKNQCETALEINPQFVKASVNLGYVLYRQQRYEASLSLFDQLSNRYPTHSALFLNYGFLEYLEFLRTKKEDMLKQAASHTLKAWNLNPQSDIAALNLGYFYYELGDIVQAVEFWNKAQALLPNDAECLAGLALGKEKLGDRKTALNLLAQAIQIDANYRDPVYLVKNNNWSDRAAKDLTKLIRLTHRN